MPKDGFQTITVSDELKNILDYLKDIEGHISLNKLIYSMAPEYQRKERIKNEE